ncbi:diacylglycerol kinase family protein [Pauljensenia sp. UMB3104]|uniref:diacylglycerol/lipid kinase family protein n=1 Tax=Pauljensenia sp. UMB3104 TaxID=3046331 RepID=UPI002551A2AB|nr:diacylglycerol kinase family protein [Pauljensenia sp. UMB3104]MDK7159963.1 diacylglycerol kinase family protein [Pauljensenia sp. UMB3104]
MGASGARRSILLLVSSMSAGGRSVRLGPRIVRILRGGGWEVAVRLTTPGDDPAVIAGGVVAGSIVAALGGDGYLSAVARGCHESDAIFAPLPGGRGNDLCRALGIGTDPLARARSLARLGFTSDEAGALSSDSLTSRVRPLDGMWVRSREGVRLALGVVSIGLDARANILANESSLTSGPLAYGYGAFAALASHEPTDIVATVDGRERNMSGWIASVSNSGRFGGGITLVDSSDMNDGILEVCHVGPLPMSRALPVLASVVAGRAKTHPAIDVESARVVSFAAPAGTIAMADGDRVASIPFTVDVAPGVVSVLV